MDGSRAGGTRRPRPEQPGARVPGPGSARRTAAGRPPCAASDALWEAMFQHGPSSRCVARTLTGDSAASYASGRGTCPLARPQPEDPRHAPGDRRGPRPARPGRHGPGHLGRDRGPQDHRPAAAQDADRSRLRGALARWWARLRAGARAQAGRPAAGLDRAAQGDGSPVPRGARRADRRVRPRRGGGRRPGARDRRRRDGQGPARRPGLGTPRGAPFHLGRQVPPRLGAGRGPLDAAPADGPDHHQPGRPPGPPRRHPDPRLRLRRRGERPLHALHLGSRCSTRPAPPSAASGSTRRACA